jgi:Zn-dependent protease
MENGGVANFIIWFLPLIIAVVLHEIAHGLAAEKLGDPTARKLGRITLNPIKHIDLFWTIVIPTILILSQSQVIFGGAKPVPVDPRNFKNPRKGMMFVALAGPVTNFILATISALILAILNTPGITEIFPLPLLIFTAKMLVASLLINLALGIFNLMPLPPLDGGRIAVGLLPISLAKLLARIEPYGFLIILIFVYSGLFGKLFTPILNVAIKLFLPQ